MKFTNSIGQHIYSALSEALRCKVYPIYAVPEKKPGSREDDVPCPFVVYRRSGSNPTYGKDLYAGLNEYYYEIAVVSDKYDETLEIAEKTVNAMHHLSFGGSGVKTVYLSNASETNSDALYIQNLSFNITYKENN